MRTKLLVSVAISLLVGGCVTPQPAWRKTGVTPNDVHSALAQCRYDVGISKVDDAKEKALVENCMEAKGFRWLVY